MSSERNFNTISPSATSLLVMKALTDIPYAREAAELLVGRELIEKAGHNRTAKTWFARLVHFENRYKTINALLAETPATNILEMSAGFSFRGLAMAQQQNIFYVDTDLPDMVVQKQQLVEKLTTEQGITLQGTYLTHALNVLDEQQFEEVVALFPPGPLTIVNEGLLVYLNREEKAELCRIIHRVLQKRGGCWITADVYIKKEWPKDVEIPKDDAFSEELTKFLADHKVEENKFDSFEDAADFFTGCGFAITAKLEAVYHELTFVKRMPPEAVTAMLDRRKDIPVIRESWKLVNKQ